MTIVKTLAKGQVVIPKAVRERFNIYPGKKLALRVEATHIILQPLPDDPIKALRGILKGKGPSTADLLTSRKEERRREEQKVARFLRPN
jgi:AbrB family looped-hinge helix DNA binding protein